MVAFSTLAVAASLLATVVAEHGHGLHARSPHHVGRSNLQKRFSGTATYYLVGQGACGQVNVPSDFIVALNSAQYGGGYPGPNCFKPITICANGKCVGATIMDECPTCGYGSLDLSEGLFKQFASTDAGVFQMTWTFAGDEPAPAPAPSSTKKPDPTTTWKPEPTTTWKPEPTTTWKPEPTTTWEAPTTTSTTRKTTTSSPPPEPTPTPEPTTSSTSHTPTTTSSSTSSSTVESTSTTSVASTSVSVAVATSATSTSSSSAAPSASESSSSTTGSGNSKGSGSGSNLADAQQIMVAMGSMVVAANGQTIAAK